MRPMSASSIPNNSHNNNIIINLPALPFTAMENLAREILRQREASPAITSLLARCLLYVLRDLKAVKP